MQQFAFHTGRCHQSKDHGYTARTDTDRKRDGIKYLLLDALPLEAVHILAGPSLSEELESPNRLNRCLTNKYSTTQLNHRNRQTENQ